MITKHYHITDIIWHCGDYDPELPEFKNLPTEFDFSIQIDPDFLEDAEQILVDEITEHFGWLIEGLDYEEI